jgi:hypothetical protein
MRQLHVTIGIRSHSEHSVGAPIGAQDTNQSSEDWRSGCQDSGYELTKLVSGEEQGESK